MENMLEDQDLIELRKRNLADNAQILAQIKADLQKLMPGASELKKSIKPREKKNSTAGVLRRNPSRAGRYSSPTTRSRRGSVSSSSSSTVSSSDRMIVKFGFFERQTDGSDSVSLDDLDIDVDDIPIRKRAIRTHDRRSADEISEDDLKMVAVYVSEKRYDSVNGSTCHQCRQKTDDFKTICRAGECFGIRGQFCGPCLRNRYGEDAKEALKNPNWLCPPCRGICNCSFCRKRQGKSCTGILVHLARENGFSNVNDYLQSLKDKATV